MINLYTKAALNTFRTQHLPLVLPSEQLVSLVKPDAENVSQYNAITDWPDDLDEFLHPAYFQVLSIPMQLQMMVSKSFPFKPIGLVHLANKISVLRLPKSTEEFDLITKFGNIYRHKRGLVFELVTEATQDNRPQVVGTSYYLARNNTLNVTHDVSSLSLFSDRRVIEKTLSISSISDEIEIAKFKFCESIGRQYARISGDYNPIHLWPITANLFGFKQAIAHGMLTKAKVYSALVSYMQPLALAIKEQQQIQISAAFKMPVMLPNECSLHLSKADNLYNLKMVSATQESTKKHLLVQCKIIH